MTIHLFSSKTNYINKFSIPKLRENSPFHIFSITHIHITDNQSTFTVMEKQVKSMISNVIMEKDDHTLVFIQNKLHQSILRDIRIEGNQCISYF